MQEKLFPEKKGPPKVETFKFAIMSPPIHAVSAKGENYCHLIAKQMEPPFESMKVLAFGGTRELLKQVKVEDKVILVGNLEDDRGTKTFFAHGLSLPGDTAPKRAYSAVEDGIKFYGSRAELKEAIQRDLEFNTKRGFVPIVCPHRERPELKLVYWAPKKHAVFYKGRWHIKIELLMDLIGAEVVNREIKKIVSGIDIDQNGKLVSHWNGSYLEWLDKKLEEALVLASGAPLKPVEPGDPEPEIDFDNLF